MRWNSIESALCTFVSITCAKSQTRQRQHTRLGAINCANSDRDSRKPHLRARITCSNRQSRNSNRPCPKGNICRLPPFRYNYPSNSTTMLTNDSAPKLSRRIRDNYTVIPLSENCKVCAESRRGQIKRPLNNARDYFNVGEVEFRRGGKFLLRRTNGVHMHRRRGAISITGLKNLG